MSKSNYFENALLQLIFNGVSITGIADNTVTSPLTNLYIALHTADPGEAGDQTTSETAYTGYVRMPLARTSGGWTITGNSASPTTPVEFGECTASPGAAITHASIGTAVSGAGQIIYSGVLSTAVTMAIGVAPRIKTTSTITED